MKVNHVGYWVECIYHSVNTFKMLGYKQKSDVFYDAEKDCFICFFDNDSTRVKLIEPASQSFLHELLGEDFEQDFHICYETTDFENAILNLQQQGFELFEQYEDIAVTNGVFMFNDKEGFIEIRKAG